MTRRRSSSIWAYSRALSDIPVDEQRIIKATELGDMGTLRALLENFDETTSTRLINCTDVKDRTILEIATENEHLEIVEFVIDHYGTMLTYESVHECIMLAISKDYVRIALALLKHPVYQRNRGTLNRLGTITNYYQRENHSKFDQDVTPLMLAAHYNRVDLIRIFLERGEVIKPPHRPSCVCNYCMNRRKFDPLKHSKSAIHTYRAMASPAYISLTSTDPILTAFLLSQELQQLSRTEKEFKNEYRELVQQCKKYTSDLLDMCQNSKEVSLILNQEATTMEEGLEEIRSLMKENVGGSRRVSQTEDYHGSTLQRLKLALLYEQKQFVSHPHCQHHLATIWYDSIPGWRRIKPFPLKMVLPLLIYLTTPIWGIIYWCAPQSRIGRIVSAPLTKFATQTVAYLFFVAALFFHSVLAESGRSIGFLADPCQDKATLSRLAVDDKERSACEELFPYDTNDSSCCRFNFRHTGIHGIDVFLFVFLVGMFWAEVKQLWAAGFKLYFASVWNCIDVCMLNLYFGAFFSKLYAHFKNDAALWYMMEHDTFCSDALSGEETATKHLYFLRQNREYWISFDPVFISEALFATANVLSFSRLSYILPISEFLGPLQISLGRMIGDIIRFGVVFCVVFLAFFCSFLNLYWFLAEESQFGTFLSTLLTLFWSLFGMAESTDPNVPDIYKKEGNDFGLTSGLGTVLFVTYHIVMGLVMLNMLIAMMSNSFQEIESEQDVEWKFARAKLWMSYFEKGATLPVPFNVVPSPKSFYRIYKWLSAPVMRHLFRRTPTHHRRERVHMARRITGEVNIIRSNDITRVECSDHQVAGLTRSKSATQPITLLEIWQNTMKAIVKRYLFELQRMKDADEVNEGELEEIKNDISSFRFELIELLSSENGDVAATATGKNARGTVYDAELLTGGKSRIKAGDSARETGNDAEQLTSDSNHSTPGNTAQGTRPVAGTGRTRPGRANAIRRMRNYSWPDRDAGMYSLDQKISNLGDELFQMKREILAALSGNSDQKSVRFSLDSEEDVILEEDVQSSVAENEKTN